MGNVEDKRRILKEIDKDFDITFDPGTVMFTITHKSKYFMNVKYGEFDRNTVEHIRKVKWLNENGLLFDDIDNHNKQIEKNREKQVEDMAYCMAKDMRKPLIKEHFGY